MENTAQKKVTIREREEEPQIPLLTNALPMRMLVVRDRIMKYFRPILKKHRFTEQQWRVVRSLQQGKKGTLQLSQECAIMPSSMSRLTQGLVKRGLVVRISSSNLKDLRQVQFALTEKGEEKIREIAPKIQAAYQEIQDKAGEDNVREILRLLNALAEEI